MSASDTDQTRRARTAGTWISAGIAGLVAYWIALVLMLGREGIGPGDELSILGQALPILAGLGMFTLVAWRGKPRRIAELSGRG